MKFLVAFVIVVLALAAVQPSEGLSFFGLGKKSTTTTTENILSPDGPSSTPGKPLVPQNTNAKGCWWTACGSRCPGTAQVAGASMCPEVKNTYKFQCCSA